MKEIFQVIRFVLGIVTILSSQSEGFSEISMIACYALGEIMAMSVSKVNVV